MEKEICVECDEPTVRAGRHDDSLFLYEVGTGNEYGPLCEVCYCFQAARDELYTVE